ncbi:MAG: HAMP domain-containing sensor histidine kinase [Chthoniobacteraceae bacterium]
MKKSIWIFLLAVLLPSVVLGWLALRSAEEQQIILERRTAELYQKETDAAADATRAAVDEQRRAFADAVRRLLAAAPPADVARDFSLRLATAWPRKAIGFALGADGKLLSPSAQAARGNSEWQTFLVNNGGFLSGSVPAQVYWVAGEELGKSEAARKSKSGYDGKLVLDQSAPVPQSRMKALAKEDLLREETRSQRPELIEKDKPKLPVLEAEPLAGASPPALPAPAAPLPAFKSGSPPVAAAKKAMASAKPAESKATNVGKTAPGASVPTDKPEAQQVAQFGERQDVTMRNVAPQRILEDNNAGPVVSNLNLATADFPALTSNSEEGVVTRFVQDRLDILFWMRPPQAPEIIFGCLVEASSLSDLWPTALPNANRSSSRSATPEFIVALLDDKARPVATQPPGETGREWKRPFVASEIGEALPHWEAALYLMRPQQLEESARSVRRTLALLIVAALGAIACGGWIVVADARRQMALAQQKTDFVSNVSHELKTPLTSIRMFAELMQNGAPETKRSQYLRIIMFEAERLTRLINNVLDFARIDRGQKRYDKRPLGLHALVARIWESHELHLRESGFTTRWDAAPPPYPVVGDADALAQILVNLLSNAEKYCGERKEVELRTTVTDSEVCVSVLDRGLGVPVGQEQKIFDAFHRAHDSLASGIQGSGLGLTLAQRLAREHDGRIEYAARDGGGSIFTLRLPLATSGAGNRAADANTHL